MIRTALELSISTQNILSTQGTFCEYVSARVQMEWCKRRSHFIVRLLMLLIVLIDSLNRASNHMECLRLTVLSTGHFCNEDIFASFIGIGNPFAYKLNVCNSPSWSGWLGSNRSGDHISRTWHSQFYITKLKLQHILINYKHVINALDS